MIHTLEMPWGVSHPKVKYWKDRKVHVYKGAILPPELRPYKSEDFSYQRWQEDEMNGLVLPPEKSKTIFKPKEHQVEAAKKILQSYNSGSRGFLIADKTGVGKGLAESTIIPTPDGYRKLKDIQRGDFVYSETGEATRVLEKNKSNAETFYEIKLSDGTIIHADSDHRWVTEDPTIGTQKAEINLTKENLKFLRGFLKRAVESKMPVTSQILHTMVGDSVYNAITRKCEILNMEGIKAYHPQELLEQLYNSTTTNTKKLRNTKELYESMSTTAHFISASMPITGNDLKYTITPYDLAVMLTNSETGTLEETIQEKVQEFYGEDSRGVKVPLGYLNASVSDRLNMLSGFMPKAVITDKGTYVIESHNEVMHNTLRILVASLGWVAYERYNKLEFRPNYETLTNAAGWGEISRFPSEQIEEYYDRKVVSIKEIEKTEEYYCLSVDNDSHLYLCTESFIVTHNTLSTLAGVTVIAKNAGFGETNKAKLLIVCPKSVIPGWRQTLRNYPIATALMRPLIINYQQLNKLIQPPATTKVAKKARGKNRQIASKGTPTVDWDYIIFDEAHYLKNFPSSTTSVAASTIAKLDHSYRQTVEPFVVYSTATPGASPLNFALMSGWLAPLISSKSTAKNVGPKKWGEFLEGEGFSVKKGKAGYNWISMPWGSVDNAKTRTEKIALQRKIDEAKKSQRVDAQRIGRALIKPGAPFIMRSPSQLEGWPEQQVIPFPIELNSKQQPIYQQAWSAFRKFLNLSPIKKDPKAALVQRLRYAQKSSLLKVDSMADFIIEQVESDKQVYVSLRFIETLDRYLEILLQKGIKVVEISGRNTEERENNRLKFQKGEAEVALCTVVAGISLHSGESLPDGSKATSNERVTIIHDLRDNNLDSTQSLGRAHRDAQNSIAFIPVLAKTIDEVVVQSFANKTANMDTMTGSAVEDAEELERIFRKAAASTTPPNRFS